MNATTVTPQSKNLIQNITRVILIGLGNCGNIKFKTKKRDADTLCIWKNLDTKSQLDIYKWCRNIVSGSPTVENKAIDIAIYTVKMHDEQRAAKNEYNKNQMAMVREK